MRRRSITSVERLREAIDSAVARASAAEGLSSVWPRRMKRVAALLGEDLAAGRASDVYFLAGYAMRRIDAVASIPVLSFGGDEEGDGVQRALSPFWSLHSQAATIAGVDPKELAETLFQLKWGSRHGAPGNPAKDYPSALKAEGLGRYAELVLARWDVTFKTLRPGQPEPNQFGFRGRSDFERELVALSEQLQDPSILVMVRLKDQSSAQALLAIANAYAAVADIESTRLWQRRAAEQFPNEVAPEIYEALGLIEAAEQRRDAQKVKAFTLRSEVIDRVLKDPTIAGYEGAKAAWGKSPEWGIMFEKMVQRMRTLVVLAKENPKPWEVRFFIDGYVFATILLREGRFDDAYDVANELGVGESVVCSGRRTFRTASPTFWEEFFAARREADPAKCIVAVEILLQHDLVMLSPGYAMRRYPDLVDCATRAGRMEDLEQFVCLLLETHGKNRNLSKAIRQASGLTGRRRRRSAPLGGT